MTRDYLIKLTVALYKVTDLFPEKEPLKYQIREKANQILAILLGENPQIDSSEKEQLLKNLTALFGYFKIAKTQNWVNNQNLEVLEKEYSKLREKYLVTFQEYPSYIEKRPKTPEKKQSPIEKRKNVQIRQKKRASGKISPKERKEKILNLLAYKKSLTLSEIKSIFFQVSPRTIRRDMEELIKQGIVARRRKGQKDVVYTLTKSDIKVDTP